VQSNCFLRDLGELLKALMMIGLDSPLLPAAEPLMLD
jgi:hypothetical protein